VSSYGSIFDEFGGYPSFEVIDAVTQTDGLEALSEVHLENESLKRALHSKNEEMNVNSEQLNLFLQQTLAMQTCWQEKHSLLVREFDARKVENERLRLLNARLLSEK